MTDLDRPEVPDRPERPEPREHRDAGPYFVHAAPLDGADEADDDAEAGARRPAPLSTVPAGHALPFDDPGWSFTGPGGTALRDAAGLEVRAECGADLFAMPGWYEADGVPLFGRTLTGDHMLWTDVTVRGRTFGDAGGIVVHGDDGWFKVCVERTRAGGWAVVTVVSRPLSDEAAGPALAGPRAELLVTRDGARHAVFCREDPDEPWRFVRTFVGDAGPRVRVGLFAQAPFSEGCAAGFTSVRWAPVALADRR
ncbi:DUF1349 domain-containing protein [Streptomyces sp. NPDC048606]|uniref:DUF1349 domain-containing protein n=1 Tax=Streptomyces sp. NPDC048606 TaxID=3154726 RepID=UPI00342FC81C